ncbi:hypothetical protein DFJ74DRAFT_695394 [Hyaloraphidium curvatum]|nr:hypothetical protein DFJ74DRAFT_695394 [Hyaloraphidium curvatum]
MATFEPFSEALRDDSDSSSRNPPAPAPEAAVQGDRLDRAERVLPGTADASRTPSLLRSVTSAIYDGFSRLNSYIRGPPRGPFRRILVVGGGYAGIAVVRQLESLAVSKHRLNVEIVLLERRDSFFHCIAAVRALTEPGYAEKLWIRYDRVFAADSRGVLMTGTEVLEVHPSYVLARQFSLDDDSLHHVEVPYDYLVIATGLPNRIPARFPPSFVTSNSAIELQRAIYEKLNSEAVSTVLVVGGGGVGVECSGELASFFGDRKRIVLVEKMATLLPGKGITDDLRNSIHQRLGALGVEILVGWEVIEDPSRPKEDLTDAEYHELGVELFKGCGKLWFEQHGFVGGQARRIHLRRPAWWLEARARAAESGDDPGEPNESDGPAVELDRETETFIDCDMQLIFTGNLPPSVPVLAFPKLHDSGEEDSPTMRPSDPPEQPPDSEELITSGDDGAAVISPPILTGPIPHEPHTSPWLHPVTFELRVNSHLQLESSAPKAFPTPHVFAVGDVCGVSAPKLAWSAKSQAKVVAANIVKLIREEGRFGIAGAAEEPDQSFPVDEDDSVGSNVGSQPTTAEDLRNPSSATFLPRRLEFLASVSADLEEYADYEGASDPVGLIVMLGRTGGVAQMPVLGLLGDSFVSMVKARDGGLGWQLKEMGY